MSASANVHRVATDSIPVLEAAPWRGALCEELKRGGRVLTMFGQRDGDHVRITTVIRATEGALRVTRGLLSVERGYHELTTEHPALHCFERELHEQTGVRIAGHPWLKPMRYEAHRAATMASHPYYSVAGKEVHEVAVGPIHAGIIEPGSFRFMCLGERVHHLEIQLGYQHRGVERRLLEGEPTRLGPIVETVAGDTSVAHVWAYCAALESLSGCTVESAVDMGRAIALELERVAMHLSSLAGLAADVGFQLAAASYGRLRTAAINTTMLLCGSRFGRTAVRPGGGGMRLRRDTAAALRANVELLRTDLPAVDDCFLTAQSVQHRLRGVGRLSAAQAKELGLVGLVARASGVPIDLRQSMTGGAYAGLRASASAARHGDCWARAAQRADENDSSLAWLAEVATGLTSWERTPPLSRRLDPNQLVVSAIEGFRGEVVHCIETDAKGGIAHYKLQDPSFRNWMGLAIAARGEEISDFPICNKSFDLSYCGHDL